MFKVKLSSQDQVQGHAHKRKSLVVALILNCNLGVKSKSQLRTSKYDCTRRDRKKGKKRREGRIKGCKFKKRGRSDAIISIPRVFLALF